MAIALVTSSNVGAANGVAPLNNLSVVPVAFGGTGTTSATGTGQLVLSNSPSILGGSIDGATLGAVTPVSIVATSITVQSLTVAGVATSTFTGTGSLVMSTLPVLVSPSLGTPLQLNLANAVGLPLASGVIGTLPVTSGGTGVTSISGLVKGTGTGPLISAVAGVDYVSPASLGQPSGIATLDSSGQVPLAQIPASLMGALNYQGTWNAETNTPSLTTGVGTKGFYYKVSVAGSTLLNGITKWNASDLVIYDGTGWDKVDGVQDQVLSVNGMTGSVLITRAGIGAAASGVNADITSITGLNTPLAISQGGTGSLTRQAAVNALAGVTTSGMFLRGDGSNVSMAAIRAVDVPTLNQNTTGSAATVTQPAQTAITSLGTLTGLAIYGPVSFVGTTSSIVLNGGSGVTGQILTSKGPGKTPAWMSVPALGSDYVTSIDAVGGTTGLSFTGGPVTSTGVLTLGGVLAVESGGTGAIDAASARAALGAGTSNLAIGPTSADAKAGDWMPTISEIAGLDTALSLKVDTVAGKGLSTNDYTTAEQTKLAGIAAGATANATDAQLRDRTTHTGVQDIATVSGLQAALDGKQASLGYTPINASLLGAINGVATLDSSGLITSTQLPSYVDSVAGKTGVVTLVSADVGLANVDNTSDANKPVSSAQLTALNLKAPLTGVGAYGTWGISISGNSATATNVAWSGITSMPAVIAAGVDAPTARAVIGAGTSNLVIGTTSTTAKAGDWMPAIEDVTGLATALSNKVDVVAGKGLSTEDYTTAEKSKLSGIEAGAEVNVSADWNSIAGDSLILNKPVLGTAATTDSTAYATAAQGVKADTALQPAAGLSAIDNAAATKLSGIAAGATANATDAQLRDRTTHTGVQAISTVTGLQGALDGKQALLGYTPVNATLLGAINGVATLDSSGLIPSTQLPSYVDDVIEVANFASLPVTGESGKIYVTIDTEKTYRWSGSVYVYITSGAVDSVAGKTGVVTLVAADVGLANVNNTSDASKPVSTAQLAALNLKAPLTGTGASGTWDISITGTAATSSAVPWSGITGKPAFVAAGADAASARAAIGAGTSNLAVGTTSTTAKAGDWVPTVSDVTGLATALSSKVDVVAGKGLSTEDYTTAEKSKLSGIAASATANTGTVTSVQASGGTTGLSFTGGPVTSTGTLTLSGTLAVANGGTGVTTSTGTGSNVLSASPTLTGTTSVSIVSASAGVVLSGSTSTLTLNASTGTAGQLLTSAGPGATPTWTNAGGDGTVTSVNVSGGTTGLTFTGGPVTTSGTLTASGTLAVASGGTGQSTAQAAINTLAGAVTTGSYLRGNGTNVVMSAIQVGDVPVLNQSTTGNAATATLLATARTINGVSFNGSTNITINAVDSTPRVATSSVGVANGVASLDSSGFVPTIQLPASVTGAMQYQGVWNASTNSPTLTTGVGTKGYVYKVSVAGSTSLDGNSTWLVGDQVVFNGTTWDKINGSPTEVSSVAGRTGAVTLTSADVGLPNVTNVAQLASTQTLTITGDVTAPSTALSTGTIATTLVTVAQGSTGTSFVKIGLDTKGRVVNNTAVTQADLTGLLGAGSVTNTMLANSAVASLSGSNTGDETATTIKTKLGITTLSGSNTGDQTTITGNAGTATALQTARTINGVSFNGTANITVADSTKAPLTGTGTSGTWPIAISGQAGVLGSFSTNTLDTVAPSLAMPQGVSSYIINGVGAYPAGSYSGVLNLRCWTLGYGSLQFNYGYNAGNNGVWYRQAGDGTDTWSAWRKLVDSNNVGSYAPTLTGTGASGTWGISITGNAATATNVAYSGLTGTVPTWNQNTTGNATTSTSTVTVTSTDSRSVKPNAITSFAFRTYFASKTGIEGGTVTTDWVDLMAFNTYTDGTGGKTNALAFSKTAQSIFHYQGTFGATSWDTPKQLAYTDSNITGNAATATNVAYTGLTGTVPTWNQNTTGNAGTATTLQTARTINGVSFNGSANITVAASTTNTLTIGTHLTGTAFNGSSAVTIATDATSANTASTIVARDASGNFSAGTVTATTFVGALTGNASTATTASSVTGGRMLTDNYATTSTSMTLSRGTVTDVTGSAAVTLTLPASPTAGDWTEVIDEVGGSHTTVAGNGNTIMGIAQSMVIDTGAYTTVFFRYTGTTWVARKI